MKNLIAILIVLVSVAPSYAYMDIAKPDTVLQIPATQCRMSKYDFNVYCRDVIINIRTFYLTEKINEVKDSCKVKRLK